MPVKFKLVDVALDEDTDRVVKVSISQKSSGCICIRMNGQWALSINDLGVWAERGIQVLTPEHTIKRGTKIWPRI